MAPLWLMDVTLWATIFFVGYYTCRFKLEKQFKKKLLLQTEKLQRKIRQLQEKS